MAICKKCGTNWPDEDGYIENHHIWPKGWKLSEETIPLCRKCHDIIHHRLFSHLGNRIRQYDHEMWKSLNEDIKSHTEWWCKLKE